MNYIIAVGEPFDSINFYGPFDDLESAEYWAWAERNAGLNWWILELEKP